MQLFEESKIKNITLKNRFFRAATWEALADSKGHLTDELVQIYEDLAKGGVGAIITGYAFVTENEQPNPGMLGIYSDAFIDEYKAFTDKIHSYKDENGISTKIILQIAYGGTMSGLEPPSKVMFGPSSVQNEVTGLMATEMTKDDIKTVVQAFADGVRRAKEANFDAAELHVAHGYLLSMFLSPYYNQREDEYGGSIENRIRIVVEIIEKARKLVGNDYPIFAKINSEDFASKGLTQEDCLQAIKILEKASLDAIEISGGNASFKESLDANKSPARGRIKLGEDSYHAEFALKAIKEISIPIILTGGNLFYKTMQDLNTKGIEYFALARPLVREADLINKWKNSTEETALCISCNKCFVTEGKRCIFNLKKK